MKRLGMGVVTLLAVITCVGLLRSPNSAIAQTDAGRGWIEGCIVNEKGEATITIGAGSIGADISVRPVEGNGYRMNSDTDKGGFYTFRNLKPGVYEVFVGASFVNLRDEKVLYRPQHLFGVVIEPDKRTVLNIVVHEGKEMEEIGRPVIPTQKAIIISEELAKLQRQIDELKRK